MARKSAATACQYVRDSETSRVYNPGGLDQPSPGEVITSPPAAAEGSRMSKDNIDYARVSLADVRGGLDRIAIETQQTFGAIDAPQLNWRPDESRWSAAQCLQHLLTVNDRMMQAADRALDASSPKTL